MGEKNAVPVSEKGLTDVEDGSRGGMVSTGRLLATMRQRIEDTTNCTLRIGCREAIPNMLKCPLGEYPAANFSREFRNSYGQLGFSFDYLYEVSQIIMPNCNMEVLRLEGGFGRKEGGEWDGLVGGLVSNQIDLVPALLGMNEERSQAIYFTQPQLAQRPYCFVINPPKESGRLPLMDPFHGSVWVAWILLFLLIQISLVFSKSTVVSWRVQKSKPGKYRRLRKIRPRSWKEIIAFVNDNAYDVPFRQKYRKLWRGMNGLALITIWSFGARFGLLFYASEFVRLQTPNLYGKLPFKTARGAGAAIDSMKYKMVSTPSTIDYQHIIDSQFRMKDIFWPIRDAWARNPVILYEEQAEVVKHVESTPGSFALIDGMTALRMRNAHCFLYIVPTSEIPPNPLSLAALPFNYTFTRKNIVRLLEATTFHIREFGISSRIEKLYKTHVYQSNIADRLCKHEDTAYKPISMDRLSNVFTFYVLSLISTVFSLVCEKIFQNFSLPHKL